MNFKRQKYKDIDYQDLDTIPFNLVQLKYDGQWCRLEVDDKGKAVGYSRTGIAREFPNLSVLADSIIVGEFLFGTQWSLRRGRSGKFVVFDCVKVNGNLIDTMAYVTRIALLQQTLANGKAPFWLKQAITRGPEQLDELWNSKVLGGDFEGIVLRNVEDPWGIPLYRCKRDFEKTLFAVEFKEGEGKHAGRLGSIGGAEEQDGPVLCWVGGGFSDEEREYIWENKLFLRNKQFDAVGKAVFSSGALRHPNFVRWKDLQIPNWWAKEDSEVER